MPGEVMSAVAHPAEFTFLRKSKLRHKSARRRRGREVRFYFPFAVLCTVFAMALGSTVAVEWMAAGGAAAPRMQGDGAGMYELAYSSTYSPTYSPTMSISSTSKVSAAPPGIVGGAPLSP